RQVERGALLPRATPQQLRQAPASLVLPVRPPGPLGGSQHGGALLPLPVERRQPVDEKRRREGSHGGLEIPDQTLAARLAALLVLVAAHPGHHVVEAAAGLGVLGAERDLDAQEDDGLAVAAAVAEEALELLGGDGQRVVPGRALELVRIPQRQRALQ